MLGADSRVEGEVFGLIVKFNERWKFIYEIRDSG